MFTPLSFTNNNNHKNNNNEKNNEREGEKENKADSAEARDMSQARYHVAPTATPAGYGMPPPRPKAQPRRSSSPFGSGNKAPETFGGNPADQFVYNHAAFTQPLDPGPEDEERDDLELRLPSSSRRSANGNPRASCLHRLAKISGPLALCCFLILLFLFIIVATREDHLTQRIVDLQNAVDHLQNAVDSHRRAYYAKSIFIGGGGKCGAAFGGVDDVTPDGARVRNLFRREAKELTICLKVERNKNSGDGMGTLFHILGSATAPSIVATTPAVGTIATTTMAARPNATTTRTPGNSTVELSANLLSRASLSSPSSSSSSPLSELALHQEGGNFKVAISDGDSMQKYEIPYNASTAALNEGWERICLSVGFAKNRNDTRTSPSPSYGIVLTVDGQRAMWRESNVSLRLDADAVLHLGRLVTKKARRSLDDATKVFQGGVEGLNIWDYVIDLDDASHACPEAGPHYGNALSWYPAANQIDIGARVNVEWKRLCG